MTRLEMQGRWPSGRAHACKQGSLWFNSNISWSIVLLAPLHKKSNYMRDQETAQWAKQPWVRSSRLHTETEQLGVHFLGKCQGPWQGEKQHPEMRDLGQDLPVTFPPGQILKTCQAGKCQDNGGLPQLFYEIKLFSSHRKLKCRSCYSSVASGRERRLFKSISATWKSPVNATGW